MYYILQNHGDQVVIVIIMRRTGLIFQRASMLLPRQRMKNSKLEGRPIKCMIFCRQMDDLLPNCTPAFCLKGF